MTEEEIKSRISKGAGWGIGYAIGISIGLIFGILMDNVGVGIAVGVAIGAGIGVGIGGRHRQETVTPEQKNWFKISIIIALIILFIGIFLFAWIYLTI